MHSDAAPKEARPHSKLSLTARSRGPTSPYTKPQAALPSSFRPSDSTLLSGRSTVASPSEANPYHHPNSKKPNWGYDMQTQEPNSQGPLASQFDLGTTHLSTQAREATGAPSRNLEPPRVIDPLDEESDSEESSDDSSDSDSSSGSEGIEVISAEDSSDEDDDVRHVRAQVERLKAQQAVAAAAQALSATVVPAAPARPTTTPEKASATSSVALAHSPHGRDSESTSALSTQTKESPAAGGVGMDICCIEGCTKVHSNHVYNEAVGRMRDMPNSQRMCRAHYIQGLGQCCVKDCTNKATNRNLKKGAKLPIKEGLHDQLHKVCMEHWNMVDQQTRGQDSKQRGKRKNKKETKVKGKRRRRSSSIGGDSEVEAFLASELGSKGSGESELGHSDAESEGESETRRSGNEFYAVKPEGKGEKRLASTLSEEDASSDDFDRDAVKRRRLKEENGKPYKAGKERTFSIPGRAAGVQVVDRYGEDSRITEFKAKETKPPVLDGEYKSEVHLLRNEVAQLRNELKEMKRFMKEAMSDQLSLLKTECLGLIGSKLTEAHEREMVQLRLLQSTTNRPRPAGAQQQGAATTTAAPTSRERPPGSSRPGPSAKMT